MRSILTNLATRMAALVPAAVATLLATRLILGEYDVEVFNAFTLVFSLMLLIPLNDLGAGAALTTAVAEDGPTHPHTQQVALTAARALTSSGLGLAVLALAVSAIDGWEAVLGEGAYATAAYGIAIALYGLSFVPALAQSVLLGVNRNEVTILVQASLAPAMAAGVAVCVVVDAPAWGVVVVPGVAILAVSLLNAAVSPHETGLRLLPLLPKLLQRRRYPGAKISAVAGPALIVLLTAPITLQSQRLILSHFATAEDVAKFSVTVQVFLPLFTLLPAAARPLWPIFARQRVTGVKAVSLGKVLVLFFTGTLLAATVLVLLANPIAEVISDDQVDLGLAMPVFIAVGTLIQSIALPVSMAMMYPAGLRVIARLSLIATPINLVGSVLLTQAIGGLGPLWVGGAVTIFLQLIPSVAYLAKHGPGSQLDGELDEVEAAMVAEVDLVPVPQLAPEPAAEITFEPVAAPEPAPVPTGPPKPGVGLEGRWRETPEGRTW